MKPRIFPVSVCQHLKMAKDRCSIFHGREDLLEKVQTILSRDTNRQPIVVHGHSGCGKTSLMAMTAQKVRVMTIHYFKKICNASSEVSLSSCGVSR